MNRLPKLLGEPKLTQYVSHLRAYAELLFRAGLLEQCIEVLKIVPSLPHLSVDGLNNMEWDGLGESIRLVFSVAPHLTTGSFSTDMSEV